MTYAKWRWIELGLLLLVIAAIAGAWAWTDLRAWVDPSELGSRLEPYRSRWFILPLTVGLFVVAELVMFPLLVLIFVCGFAFGPWLGATSAMAGALASAILPFLLGRRLGRKRLERWGGRLVSELAKALRRKGVLAVFLVRKIPAPYTAVNLVCGACGLRLRDFLVGTFLGLVTVIVLITVVGAQFMDVLAHPEPRQLVIAFGSLALAVTLAFVLQRVMRRRLEPPA